MTDQRRCEILGAERGNGKGPVLYWMLRDMRVDCNWALLKAIEIATLHETSVVVLVLAIPNYLKWTARHYHFMFQGMKEVRHSLISKNINFRMIKSDSPVDSVAKLVKELDACQVVTDFLPLREKLGWDKNIASALKVPFVRVDAHNIVPCFVASPKQEYAARTIRPKIMNILNDFLTPFPDVQEMRLTSFRNTEEKELDSLYDAMISQGSFNKQIHQVDEYFKPGYVAGIEKLNSFLHKNRLGRFDTHRNDPNHGKVISGLSPYINFGHISAQNVVSKAQEFSKENKLSSKSLAVFVEEIVVRRELSDNFCFYNSNYDRLECAYQWAQDTLALHSKDSREYVYSYETFAQGKTHDDLWNAAQIQLVKEGKMHGFLRMYWCKKILEWTESPQQALEFALDLNDTFAIDGNCPNGFVGVGMYH